MAWLIEISDMKDSMNEGEKMIQPQTDRFGNYTIHPKLVAADAMNTLLRGEISAVEAYKQVIEKLSGDPEHKRLLEFLNHHQRMVAYWRDRVNDKQMAADNTSGPWGYVVEAFVGVAKLFGDVTALRALKKGEEHGLQEYYNFLENEYVSKEDKRFVRMEVIPALEMHVSSIKAMTKMH